MKERLQQDIAYIEKVLEEKVQIKDTPQKQIFEAMQYSLMAGGKRLRPVFMLEMFRLFGGKEEKALECFMAAQEMIHTYSLVHDDLPAMDDDEYRRGRKTTHVVYGYAMGILAGDSLLNDAFTVASEAFNQSCEMKRVAKALQILAKKAGSEGMLGGQVVDVTLTGKPLNKEQLDFIYKLKTAALLESSMMIGAILAGADEEEVDKVEKIATCVGMAFQIQDDILDVTSTAKELGKPIGSDEKNEKTTYVSLFGLDKAKAEVERYTKEALVLLEGLQGDSTFLKELSLSLIHRKN